MDSTATGQPPVTGWVVMSCVSSMAFLCGSTFVKVPLLHAGTVAIWPQMFKSNELTNIFCIHRLPIRPATLYSLSQVNWLSSASHLETQHGESMSWMRGLQLLQQGCFLWQFTGCVLYTYTVRRVAYTDKYRACIWMSLGEYRYERYESVYVTLLTV